MTGYLKFTEPTEPPKSYHVWTGLSLIAGSLQRKCHATWGHETIYPNLYIVLIGQSGKVRKGTAMRIGRSIFMDVGLPMVSESITRQALIESMQEANANYNENGRIVFHCSLMCMSEELSVFLGQRDIAFLADLTDWYDSRDDWKYKTRARGEEHIQGVCFNLLGATAPDWLQSILPMEAVGGGFTSRVFFIVEENKSKVVPIYNMTDEDRKLREDLVHDLQMISLLTGDFQYTKEAINWYTSWYVKTEKDAERGIKPINDPHLTGYCERRATHVRKLSMSFSASRSESLIVEIEDFKRALAVMEAAEIKMHRTFGGLGKSQYAQVIEMVLDYLLVKRTVMRSELLSLFWRDIDPQSLQVAETILTQMKVISIERVAGDKEVDLRYTYIGPN